MSGSSAIEWTEATWNPVTGCDRISPGCDHCYALTLAGRLKRMGQPRYQADGDPRTSGPGFKVTLHEDKLVEPFRWRKPRLVFVNSMSDLFHKDVPMEYVARVFAAMAAADQHTFQVLTKRPKRMARMLNDVEFRRLAGDATIAEHGSRLTKRSYAEWPLPNVWLGTSIESSTYAWRADHLRETPAAVRFISAEPLLEPLVFPDGYGGWYPGGVRLHDIDWLIVGGESGAGHRPIDPQWVRDLRDAARASGTAFFFKQWGGHTPKAGGRELDGRTWDEMPTLSERPVVA
jgi:protein gp37